MPLLTLHEVVRFDIVCAPAWLVWKKINNHSAS